MELGVTPRCLGESISSIELDIPSLTDQQVEDLENEVNERILASIPVTPHLYHDKNDPELKQVLQILMSCQIETDVWYIRCSSNIVLIREHIHRLK